MLGVKLAGSVLVLVACTGVGLDQSLEYRRRLRMLSELRRMFLLLAGEIRSSRTPAGDAFSHMAARMDGIYRDFLEKLSGALRQEGRGRFDRLWKEQVLESFEKHRQIIQRVGQHQVHVVKSGHRFCDAGQHRRAKTDVGDKMAVHYVKMQKIRPGVQTGAAVFFQMCKIRGEQRGCNHSHGKNSFLI